MASKMNKVQLTSAVVSALSKAEVSGLEMVDPDQSGSFYGQCASQLPQFRSSTGG